MLKLKATVVMNVKKTNLEYLNIQKMGISRIRCSNDVEDVICKKREEPMN